MNGQLLHVFRNTPLGRETLMHSAYFCQRAGLALSLYVPENPQFLMYFDQTVVTVDLDRAFLRSPATAVPHAGELLDGFGIEYNLLVPTLFTKPELPALATDYSYMCCPRSISDMSTKIGLGYIGPRVRSIIKNAAFPVLMPSPVFKEWKSIVCFFGGSANAINAMEAALDLSARANLAMFVLTQDEGKGHEFYQSILSRAGMRDRVRKEAKEWIFLEHGDLRENLYQVPHDALVVVGAHGGGLARQLVFGSKMEIIQTVLPNPMLIVGPNWSRG